MLRRFAAGLTAGALAVAVAFLPEQEGRLTHAHPDPVHGWVIPTICSGHTKGVKRGDTATPAQCAAYLKEDISDAWAVIERNVPAKVRGQMPDKTKAAFTSFVFQYGPGGRGIKDGFVYLKSGAHSTMYKKLVAGDIAGACRELPKWNREGRKGIANRQARTMALCLEDLQ